MDKIEELETVHRIKIRQIPTTSGKDWWEIWKWNSEQVLWENITKSRIVDKQEAIDEAEKSK